MKHFLLLFVFAIIGLLGNAQSRFKAILQSTYSISEYDASMLEAKAILIEDVTLKGDWHSLDLASEGIAIKPESYQYFRINGTNYLLVVKPQTLINREKQMSLEK